MIKGTHTIYIVLSKNYGKKRVCPTNYIGRFEAYLERDDAEDHRFGNEMVVKAKVEIEIKKPLKQSRA